MRYVICLLLLVSFAAAKDRAWEDAAVLKVTQHDAGTSSVILPMGTGIYAGTRNNVESFYWLRTTAYTYAVPTSYLGHWGYPPLALTVGGKVKISIDNSKQMHLVDDDGKVRKVRIAARKVSQPVEEGGR